MNIVMINLGALAPVADHTRMFELVVTYGHPNGHDSFSQEIYHYSADGDIDVLKLHLAGLSFMQRGGYTALQNLGAEKQAIVNFFDGLRAHGVFTSDEQQKVFLDRFLQINDLNFGAHAPVEEVKLFYYDENSVKITATAQVNV